MRDLLRENKISFLYLFFCLLISSVPLNQLGSTDMRRSALLIICLPPSIVGSLLIKHEKCICLDVKQGAGGISWES